MKKSAKSSRAPLAPLHNNSLRGESPRKAAKGGDRQSAKSFEHKTSNKLPTAQATKANKAIADLPDRAHNAGSKPARAQSPAKARKSVQLVTTSAVPGRSKTLARIKQGLKKPAEAPSAKQAAAGVPSAVLQLDRLHLRQRAAHQSASSLSENSSGLAPPTVVQAAAGTLAAAPLQIDTSTSPSVLRHWHLPATPSSISALLGSPETAAAGPAQWDVQKTVTQATPQPGVQGVGTPQDFSNVFDLDEVNMHCSAICTPGGSVTSCFPDGHQI